MRRLDDYIPRRIRWRLVWIGIISWTIPCCTLGLGVRAAALGAVVYALVVLAMFLCRLIMPPLRVFLPEAQASGAGSAAALLYWGLGWWFPAATLVAAMCQTAPLNAVDVVLLALAMTIGAAAAYALLVEPKWIDVRGHDLPYDDLPQGLEGFRIVHISDLHVRRTGRAVERIVQRIASLQPNIVCITGDLANEGKAIDTPSVRGTRQMLSGLRASHGVYVVLGDWDGLNDGWPDVQQELFPGPPIQLLNDAFVRLHIDGDPLVILGRAPAHQGAKPNYMAQLPKDGFSIVLHHYPFGAIRAAELGAHLYLAGHTHGGQVRLPLLGGFYRSPRGGTDRQGRCLPRRFSSGLHRLDQTWVHVSRGLGTRGGDAPPVRFCCRPDITLLTLRRTRDNHDSGEICGVGASPSQIACTEKSNPP